MSTVLLSLAGSVIFLTLLEDQILFGRTATAIRNADSSSRIPDSESKSRARRVMAQAPDLCELASLNPKRLRFDRRGTSPKTCGISSVGRRTEFFARTGDLIPTLSPTRDTIV